MHYIAWAALGMVSYSTVTLMVKLATRTGELNAFAVLAIATTMVAVAAVANAWLAGVFVEKSAADFLKPSALYAYAAGLALTVAVGSLFKGLSLGPASVVVPVYGMFIIGGAVLGVLVLGEPMTIKRALGMALAVVGVVLVAG
ncbi:MAG: EamA family transporter [Acetobacteraceae bacterium]|nr:EamA family transporter [Acetobacteraceae bacterium]